LYQQLKPLSQEELSQRVSYLFGHCCGMTWCRPWHLD
jgi:hypothetical protein